MSYQQRNPNGQATMANSEPVVIASNQSAVPVSGTVTVTDVAAIKTAVEIIDNAIAGSEMQVDVVAALPAGNNNIGDVDIASIAAGDNNIGNVDIVTMPSVTLNALPAGTNNIGDVDVLTLPVAFNTGTRSSTTQRVTIATDDLVPVSMATNTPVGTVAHDAADSGAPVKVGAKAVSSLATATMVAAADRADNVSDLDGVLIVRNHAPLGDLKSDAISNTDGASTASSVFTAVASTRNFITAIHAFRTDSGTTPIYVDFRDGTGGSVLYRVVLPPNGGVVLPSGAMPYFRTTANTALAYDVSAATSTVYINTSGFQSKL